MIRLNKYLSSRGVCSRRKADEYISAGEIKVNGEIIHDLGIKVNETDRIEFKNKLVGVAEKTIYYALNKPKGIISTSSDDLGRKGVAELVPARPRVFSVGRLDAESEGLIILTNDGELTNRLTHPSFEHEKEYEIGVRPQKGSEINFDDIATAFKRGLMIDGVLMRADKVYGFESRNSKFSDFNFKIILHTGHNRQIRKMCAKVGLEVKKLVRIRIGKLILDELNIEPGEYKKINRTDIYDL